MRHKPRRDYPLSFVILALLPVAVLSPFVQRHFKKGVLIGAIKG